MEGHKVDCCGFPQGRKQYFAEFELVELQQTFHTSPQPATAAGWRAHAPESFEFVVKAWQFITHSPNSPICRKARIQIPSWKEERYGFYRPSEKILAAWVRTAKVARSLDARPGSSLPRRTWRTCVGSSVRRNDPASSSSGIPGASGIGR